jgi:hypothetical protein
MNDEWREHYFANYMNAKRKLELICATVYARHCSENHNADFEVCKDAMCKMVRELDFDTATKGF